MSQELQAHVIINLRAVIKKTAMSRSTIYSKGDKKHRLYDSTFPKPIKLSARGIGWVESEVNAWIESRLAARDSKGMGS